MATHSTILAWRMPTDRGAWWATVHAVTKRFRILYSFTFFFFRVQLVYMLKPFHFLIFNISCSVASVMSNSLQSYGLQPTRLLHEFSRQEQWSGLPCPSPGHLPDSGIKSMFPMSPALQVDSLMLSHWESHLLFSITTFGYFRTY